MSIYNLIVVLLSIECYILLALGNARKMTPTQNTDSSQLQLIKSNEIKNTVAIGRSRIQSKTNNNIYNRRVKVNKKDK